MPDDTPRELTDASVTVGILCFNQRALISQVISAVLEQVAAATHVVVVDDGSSDGSQEVIAEVLGGSYHHELIRHPVNLGRTAARNTIVRAAKGEIIMFVDGDAPPLPGWFVALLQPFDDPRVGGVGGRGIEGYCDPVVNRWRSVAAAQTWGEQPADVPWAHGLCCAYRADVLRRAGGFTGRGEDVDIGHRVRQLGYFVRFNPDAEVLHLRNDDLSSLRHMLHRWFRSSYAVGRRWREPAGRRLTREAFSTHFRRGRMWLRVGDVRMGAVEAATLWFKLEGLALGALDTVRNGQRQLRRRRRR